MLTQAEIISKCSPVFRSKDFVEKVYLFGSYARGDATEKSDVDFMVITNKPVGIEFGGLYDLLQDALNKRVDVLTENECMQIMPKSIERDGIIIYERKHEDKI